MPTELSEFVLARIADDEATWSGVVDQAGRPDFARLATYVVAECAAKRLVVQTCSQQIARAVECDATLFASQWEDMLRRLALPYSGHAEYSEEWRPVEPDLDPFAS